jgi:hypothetical protein
MKRCALPALTTITMLLTACSVDLDPESDDWRTTSNAKIVVEYRPADAELAPTLLRYATTGTATVESVLDLLIAQPFGVRIYTDRSSMETAWAARFGTPPGGFQCWMIANADASGVVMLSPRAFATDSCGHSAQDTIETRAIIAHEVTHLIHHRINTNTLGAGGTGWLYEGIAVFASGQMTTGRRIQARFALQNTPPAQLARIMDSEAGYALAGSLVEFIAQQHGNAKVRDLMYVVTQAQVLAALSTTEPALLAAWRAAVLAS